MTAPESVKPLLDYRVYGAPGQSSLILELTTEDGSAQVVVTPEGLRRLSASFQKYADKYEPKEKS